MSCIATSVRASLLERLEELNDQLIIANATFERLLAQDIASYRFDSGEGSQQARRVKMSELTSTIEWLESRIDNIQRKLNGNRLVNMNLRRKIGRGRYARLYV